MKSTYILTYLSSIQQNLTMLYMKNSLNLAGNATAKLESQFCTPLAQLCRVFFWKKKTEMLAQEQSKVKEFEEKSLPSMK